MSASDLLSLSIFGAFCTGLVERRPAACTGAELTQGLLISCVSNRERFSRLPAAIGEWCRSSQRTDPRSLSFGNDPSGMVLHAVVARGRRKPTPPG
jgi:hypothetical protein